MTQFKQSVSEPESPPKKFLSFEEDVLLDFYLSLNYVS